jgi:hypothetical protein
LPSFSLDVFSKNKPLIKVDAGILSSCGCRYLHVVHFYWWAHFMSRGECYLDTLFLVNLCSPSGVEALSNLGDVGFETLQEGFY